jgi:hypothetical protein
MSFTLENLMTPDAERADSPCTQPQYEVFPADTIDRRGLIGE